MLVSRDFASRVCERKRGFDLVWSTGEEVSAFVEDDDDDDDVAIALPFALLDENDLHFVVVPNLDDESWVFVLVAVVALDVVAYDDREAASELSSTL